MVGKIKAWYLDHMGSDLDVVNAAKVSFDRFSEWEYDEKLEEVLNGKDVKLIQYLAKHGHWTPFAHTAIKFKISAPLPIRTQCFKHKQGFVENEESRRYIKTTPELYIPDEFRNAPLQGGAKQGAHGVHERSETWKRTYELVCRDALRAYEAMIEDGICPEQARFILPQGCVVNWIWTGSLAAYARFYLQRTDPHAQREVAMVAEQIAPKLFELFPVSWDALTRG